MKLSAGYIANLPKAIDQLTKALSQQEQLLPTLTEGSKELDRAKRKIADLKKQLATAREDQKLFTREKYEQLSQRDKNLHDKAFTTNKNDPHYHQLDTLKYKDGDTDREVKLPKGDILHQFRNDVNEGKLPTVSWIVAPENFSDHPGAAWYGAWYISEVMDILTKNPEVWKKTILVLTYDENDGYFDHVPPFVAPHPIKKETGFTTGDIPTGVEYATASQQSSDAGSMRESPIGLGFRVPLVIASPWTRGGWVNSQVFDHTSSLQFLEKFLTHKLSRPIIETNISTWRRTVCGNLTSVFRPYNGETIISPAPIPREAFIESIHKAQFKELPSNYRPLTKEEIALANKNPAALPFMPHQEKGIRNANALPYELYADGLINNDKQSFEIVLKAANYQFGNAAAGAPSRSMHQAFTKEKK
ncbi:alkaline phosphatase family protein [Paraflavitalea speifideaquila]|uniref:alkaline phosphatase family protein n=1 Tax=Paraflavitalea speifideaquila TaxID=3076558 RepID=UPI0028EFF153|nr:alkaline phosphatase family protein [Paraflavitalea speifideiaquila]